MKTLRILTGVHAGIEVRLEPGTYRIGRDDDTDVCITDWDDDEVQVELDENGVVRTRRALPEHGAEPRAGYDDGEPVFDASVILIPDLVPFPFGNTVLCFGADDVRWPPDIELLASMYRGQASDDPAAQAGATPARAPRRRLLGAAAGVLAVSGIALAASALLGRPHADANELHAPTPAQLAAQIDAQLHAAHLPALHAQAHDSLIEVDGFVANAAQDVAARDVLMKYPHARIARHYDVEQTALAGIEEALGGDGVRVAWRSPGVLGVTGRVASLAHLRETLERVQADLDSNVQRIEVDVGQSDDDAPRTLYVETMAVGDTQYVQTPDGVKHLFDYTASDGTEPARLRETILPGRTPLTAADQPDAPPQ
jgi:type III secretion protein D